MFNHGTLNRQVFKSLVALLSFAAPALFTAMPEVANLTVGVIVYGVLSYLETLAK